MPERKASIPNKRAVDGKKNVDRVRRRYKTDISKSRRLLPGEAEHVNHMVVVLRLAGYSKVQTAKVIGISVKQVTEILEDSQTSDLLISIRARLPQAALDLLQGYMIEAVQAIIDVMRKSRNDKYVLQAAGEILDRAGMPKASRQERHQINEDKLTITDDGIVEALREAPIEVQEQAAQMIEQLESLLGKGMEIEESQNEDS